MKNFRSATSAKRVLPILILAMIFAVVGLSLPASLHESERLGSGKLRIARAGHTATALRDGSVIVIGGIGSSGALNQTEVILPDGRVAAGAKAIYGRTDHTATTLADERVVVAGGRDTTMKLDTTELYDPQTGAFQIGPRLHVARANQVAVSMRDGRILLAGGDANGTAEVIDAQAQSSRLLRAHMNEARSGAGAVLLGDGRVFIVGGVDSEGKALSSAEIFDPTTETFSAISSMATPRVHPTLRVLPDGKVQVLGGDADATMEIFNPRGYFTARAYVTSTGAGADAVLRSAAKFAVIGSDASHAKTRRRSVSSPILDQMTDRKGAAEITVGGRTLLIGGRSMSIVALDAVNEAPSSSAWVTTDKTDYKPGEHVVVTGGGFAAGETVRLHFERNPETSPASDIDTVADANGDISNSDYLVQSTDLGVTFLLTATGQSSQNVATTSFTDGNVDVKTTGPNVTLTLTKYSDANCTTGAQVVSSSISSTTTSVGFGSAASIRLAVPTTAGGASFIKWSKGPGAAGPTPGAGASVCLATSTMDNTTLYVAEYTTSASTSLAVAPSSGTFGGTTSVSATLTSGATAVQGKSISFTLNGASVGSATTNASGVATLTNISLAGINAGTYAAGVGASFAGDSSFLSSSGNNQLTVAKANATISVNGFSGPYDGSAHAATGSATGVGGVNLGAQLNLGPSYINVPGGPAHWTFTGGTNYNDASGDVQIVINKANATINVQGYTGVYDAAAHGATGTASGVNSTDLSASLNLGPKFTDVPGGTAHWTFTGGTNYNDASGDVQIVINKADAAINVQGYTGIYDAAAHGATGTATGVNSTDLSAGLNLGPKFTNVPGGTAHWNFIGGQNYKDASGDVQIVINKADATINVDGYTGAYDGAAHGATGTATGVGGADLSGSLNLGATYTNVPGGPAHWNFIGGQNYNDANGTVQIVINKADATITVNGYTGAFDGAAHGATGTATGVGGADLSGSLNLGATYTNVPGGPAHWNFIGGQNYNDANGTVQIVINKADATIHVDGFSGPYDGAAHGATGTATGVGAVDLSGSLNLGASFTNVPGGTAHWTFTGGQNYNDASGDAPIDITKATSSVTVSCPASVIYDGTAQEPCSAHASGAGMSDVSLTPTYANNTNVGQATASASWDGDANHTGSSNSAHFDIDKASSSVTVSCPTSVIYNGAAQEPCSAHASGAGMSDVPLTPTYSNNTNVGQATASASWDGDANHTGSSNSAHFDITKAEQSISWSDPADITYGTALSSSQLNATVTGVAGGSAPGALTYSPAAGTLLNAGDAQELLVTAAATSNYNSASKTVHINVKKADQTISWNDPANITYGTVLSGAQLNAVVQGVAGGSATGAVSYSPAAGTLLNAGTNQPLTVNVAATSNYNAATKTVHINVDKADQTINWSNPGAITYGTALSGAQLNAVVSGVSGGSATGPATYTPAAGTVLNAGAAQTLTVNVAATSNYNAATKSVTIDVNKADQTITWNTPASITLGTALSATQLNATVAGVPGGSAPGSLTYTPAAGTVLPVGAHQALKVDAAATSNYNAATKTVYIDVNFSSSSQCGHVILQPINVDGSSVFKSGSTVPAKFKVCDVNGNSIGTPGVVKSFNLILVSSNPNTYINEDVISTTPDTAFRWDATSQQWIYNISTKGMKAGQAYTFRIVLADNTNIDFSFGLK